ncbi:MAG TPA: DUF6519 domain-containing protein [Micropepsaceae bacterium]|nr:DUF6519 domain-containing protein [Micropepsaceae bacterium]
MGADFSRVRLNPLLDYAGVELQQGRVLLDADANELVAIIDRRLRALASDTLGRATVSSTTPDAFKISVAGSSLQIGKGRLYVDGLLAENHGAASADPTKRVFDDLLAEVQFTDKIDYAAQPYFPNPPPLPTAGSHLVYLDVWDREVTHLESPGLIETAVGVDATSRIQTVWQVRVLDGDVGTGVTCQTPDDDIPGWDAIIAPSTGVLTTGTFDVAAVDDPCELPPTGGYRGLENQLYRVEIHDPGQPGTGATFKWSRENASVGSRVASVISSGELQLETLGRDDVLRFNTGDWVEITDDIREFSQAPGEIRRITVDDATRRIQFTPALPAAMLPASFPDSTFPAARHMRVRRWDQKGLVFRTDSSGTPVQVQDLDASGSTGVIAVPTTATTLLLENGVTVQFDSTGTTGFRAGDYWVFAARTADASVEILDRAPPRGIHHHYARLGIWNVGAGTVTDCRHPWPPQVQGHDCGCTACVTVESHQSGQFTIQDAVNQLLQTGGTVCLGPGQYALQEPVRILNARSLRIRGQGPATAIVSAGGAFNLQNGVAVAIENLAIVSLGRQSAITVRTAIGLSLRQLVIAVFANTDFRGAGISLQGVVAGVDIRDNAIIAPFGILANDPAAVPPVNQDATASFLLTAALAIESNLFWCQNQAVTLAGTVFSLMSTHIEGNEAVGCRDQAISALGLGAAGSSMVISNNSLNVTGSGIAAGVDGLWIESNKLVCTAAAAARTPAVGIALAAGLDKTGVDQCQILANQVTGFGTGISIGAPASDLIVKLNIIANCDNGIVSTDAVNAGSISIENNHLRNIGPAAEGATAVITAIGVTRAQTATIAGNTIRSVGVTAQQSSLRAGIITVDVGRVRVSGNEVTDIAPPSDFLGIAAAIMLRAPYAEFVVTNNDVQPDSGTSTQQGTTGTWFALAASEIDPQNAISKAGNVTTVNIDNTRVLVLGSGRAYITALSNTPATGAAVAIEPARGSVIGNVLNARGESPAVDIFAAGECLFNDNRVDARFNGKVAVNLVTSVAIVSANRVRGGELSIQVTNAKSAAVLGNITTGAIAIPGGLQPPWDALNLRG